MSNDRREGPSWRGVALLPVTIVVGLAAMIVIPTAALFHWIFRIKTTVDRTPEEVAAYLDDFIDGRGKDWDWDGFISVTITDPDLEAMRAEAAEIEPPYDVAKMDRLAAILTRLRA